MSAKPPVRVALIDDHEIVRAGLRAIIGREPGFEVCCEAADTAAGLECVRQHKPDVVVVDISMPGLSGVDAVKRIRQIHPACRVLVLTTHEETTYAPRMFRAGAHGYVTKQAGAQKLLTALQRIARGELFMSEDMQRAMLDGFVGGGKAKASHWGLTDRELEILRLLGQGLSGAEIAGKVHRSVKTIDVHRQNIKHKLNLKTTAELMRFAAKWADGEDT